MKKQARTSSDETLQLRLFINRKMLKYKEMVVLAGDSIVIWQ